MTLNVLLFAGAREMAGTPRVELDLPAGATVAEMKSALLKLIPKLQAFRGHLRFAVNSEYADDTLPIPADAEVACIPPVSGG